MVFPETRVQEKEVLTDNDACVGGFLVKCEDHKQQWSIVADGCASYKLKSGS